jgi:SpoVK/Ycf46/Vps4 family AAA+-type ATPase
MRKGFACIFHGAPGTGKTETVLQLARITGRDIMEVNISSIKSKWVGDTEKNIKSIFNRYRLYCKRSEVPPILLFNEADAIISKRNENVSTSVDRMENAMQNIILEEMEQLEGILIATTNLTSNMDKAFERRFLYKIEFCKPDLKARAQIWKSMIQGLTTEEAEMLADEFHFSGGQIENVARKQIVNHILYGTDYSIKDIRYDCLSETLQTNKECRPVIGFR